MKVSEIFASIQGEGRHVGKPQVFIRMSGCNLRCRWCDTKYAWTGGREMSVSEVVAEVKRHRLKSVCITGGEPMVQKGELRKLVDKLKRAGYEIVLETNGTLYDRGIFSKVDCVSMDMKPPSSGERSDERLLSKLKRKDQVKVVVHDRPDYEYSKDIASKSKTDVILQPEGGTNLKWLAERVIADGLKVRVIPQLHKIGGLR